MNISTDNVEKHHLMIRAVAVYHWFMLHGKVETDPGGASL